jgi:hypothetical protein
MEDNLNIFENGRRPKFLAVLAALYVKMSVGQSPNSFKKYIKLKMHLVGTVPIKYNFISPSSVTPLYHFTILAIKSVSRSGHSFVGLTENQLVTYIMCA